METRSPISRSCDLEGDPPGALSSTPKENPEASDAKGGDLDPAELASVAKEIRHEHPLAPDRTGLVLYDVDPTHLQAQWQVTLDDLARARRAFPNPSSGILLRLLLRRLDAGGGRSEVAAVDRKAGGAGLQGQVVLGVEAGDADYQAELGLASAEGGWLLLARSNQVRPLPPVMERTRPRAELLESHDPEVEPALAAEGVPLEPVFPLPVPEGADSALRPSNGSGQVRGEAVSPAASGVGQGDPNAAVAPGRGGGGDGEWAELPPPLLPSTPVEGGGDGTAADLYDPRGALSSRELSPAGPGQLYLELHAELLVWGRAAPGGLIDVFGVQLRAGPDGHFSLRLPVENHELLAHALSVVGEPPAGPDTE